MARRKTHEEFVAEVKALVGDEYTVLGTYKTNKTKILMYHHVCNEPYEVTPSNLLRGSRCTNCCRSKPWTHADYVKAVQRLVGDEYKVVSMYQRYNDAITLKHNVCGHTYPVRAGAFIDGNRCPDCCMSKGETKVRNALISLGIPHKHQGRFIGCKHKKALRFDFTIFNKIAIEYDGRQHYEVVDAWGGEESFKETKLRDAIKTQYCADNGIPLIRIPYWDFDNIDAILTEKLLPLLDASVTRNLAS